MLRRTGRKLFGEKVPFWRRNREQTKALDDELVKKIPHARTVSELLYMVGQADERGVNTIIRITVRLGILLRDQGASQTGQEHISDIVECALDKISYTPRLIKDVELLHLIKALLRVRPAFRNGGSEINAEIFSNATEALQKCMIELHERKLVYAKAYAAQALHLLALVAREGVCDISILQNVQQNVKEIPLASASLYVVAAADFASQLSQGFIDFCYGLWLRNGFDSWNRSHVIYTLSLFTKYPSKMTDSLVRQVAEELCIRGVVTPGLAPKSVYKLLQTFSYYRLYSTGLLNGITMNILALGFASLAIRKAEYGKILEVYTKLSILHSGHHVVVRKFSKDVVKLIERDKKFGIIPLKDFNILGMSQITNAFQYSSIRDDVLFNQLSSSLLEMKKKHDFSGDYYLPLLLKNFATLSYAHLPAWGPMLDWIMGALEHSKGAPPSNYTFLVNAFSTSIDGNDERWKRLENIILGVDLQMFRPLIIITILSTFSDNKVRCSRLADKITEHFRVRPGVIPASNIEQFLNSYTKMNLSPPDIVGLNRGQVLLGSKVAVDKSPNVSVVPAGTNLGVSEVVFGY